jgi:hypothetical protein
MLRGFMKHFRKITVNKRRGYGTVAVPSEIMRELTKEGATHIEFEYDEVRKVLHAFPR